jgi:acyl-coenzyme A synthetase/AMP-(fatty) acid ligase
VEIGGEREATFTPAPLDLDAPALVTYTSGSTGEPYRIVRSQRRALARVRQKILQFHLGPEDRIATLYPPGPRPH